MTIRVGFIGCVRSSRAILEVLVKMPEIEVCAVVTKNASSFNSDFTDLSGICEKFSMNNPAASYGVSSVLSSSNTQQAAGNITQERFICWR